MPSWLAKYFPRLVRPLPGPQFFSRPHDIGKKNGMTRSNIFLLQETGLTPFLHAEIGTEENGAALTMLSFLARLGQDPWAEAARLERLPHEAVTKHLTDLIRQLPLRQPAPDDAEQVAARLIELLPTRKDVPDKMPERATAFLLMAGLCIGVALALMFIASNAENHVAPAETGFATSAK